MEVSGNSGEKKLDITRLGKSVAIQWKSVDSQ